MPWQLGEGPVLVEPRVGEDPRLDERLAHEELLAARAVGPAETATTPADAEGVPFRDHLDNS